MEPTSSQWRTKGVEIDKIPFKLKIHLLCWEYSVRLQHMGVELSPSLKGFNTRLDMALINLLLLIMF